MFVGVEIGNATTSTRDRNRGKFREDPAIRFRAGIPKAAFIGVFFGYLVASIC